MARNQSDKLPSKQSVDPNRPDRDFWGRENMGNAEGSMKSTLISSRTGDMCLFFWGAIPTLEISL